MRFNGTSGWVWMPRLIGVGIVAAIGTSVLAASAYAPVASGMPAAHGHDAAAWPRSDDAHEDTASGNKPDKALDEKADKASGKTESNPKAAEDAKSASKDKNGKQDKGTPKAKDPSEKDEKEDSDKQAESEKSKSDKEKSEKETSSKEKSDKTKPEKTKSDKAKPKKAKPDKAKPKKAKPEKTESDKTKSDKATPDQRTSKTRAGKPAAAGAAGRATTTTRQKGQLKLDPAIQARIDQLVGHRRAGRAAASTRSGAHAPVGGDAKARSGAEQDAKAAPWRPGQPRPAQPHQPTPPKPKPTAPPAAGADQDQIVPVPSDAGRAPPGKPDDTADAGSAAADEADDAPLLPEEDTRPPEARTYRFSIKNGTHAQLLDGFARQAGIPIIGAPPHGQVQDLVTTEEMSYDAALNRVRMLLFKFKPNEPYWLKRYEDHFEVIRVNDMLRLLEPWQMFASVEDFRAADFPSEGLALVVYTPTSGSVSDLEMVRDFLPDYVRVTAIPDKNQLTIFALSRDIEKYLGLIDFFTGGGDGDVR
ncbi:MAG: hypothetical protein ACE5EX_08105, partial [Phycisphaerae bacterium]